MSRDHSEPRPLGPPDFVLASRLEFRTADFDGRGPRQAWVLKHLSSSGRPGRVLWHVRVVPPIRFSWGLETDEVVLQGRHAGQGIEKMLAEWRRVDPAERLPSAGDPYRWLVPVYVLPLRPGPGSLDDRYDPDFTWGEVVPNVDLVPPHTADDSGSTVDAIDQLEAWVQEEGSLPGEGAPRDERGLLGFLIDLYWATVDGRRVLEASKVQRLDALPGWREAAEARGRRPPDPRVAALARFARREGHCRVPPGHVEDGIRLDVELPRLIMAWLTIGVISEADRTELLELPGWREAMRSLRQGGIL